MLISSLPTVCADDPTLEQPGAPPGRKRRGATALEYLMAISLILVVVLITVQHLGTLTRDSFSNSSKVISGQSSQPTTP
jgi:Flp pilus assembly pilin Flp